MEHGQPGIARARPSAMGQILPKHVLNGYVRFTQLARESRPVGLGPNRSDSCPWPFPGRPPKHDLSTWTVIDNWPERVPVTEAEVEVFERWFADLFDELFGSNL